MRPIHLLGLLLWRGGLLLVAGSAIYYACTMVLRHWRLPALVEAGLGLLLSGLVLVLLSLVLERMADLRRERGLRA